MHYVHEHVYEVNVKAHVCGLKFKKRDQSESKTQIS